MMAGTVGAPRDGSKPRRRLLASLAAALLFAAWTAPALALPIAYDWQFDLGVDQVTPNDFIESRALGQAWIHYDAIADHLSVLVTWTDLVGEIEKIHIHGPALPGYNTRTHVVDILNDPSEIPAGTGLHTGQFQTLLHLFDPGDEHGGSAGGHYPPETVLGILTGEQAYMLVHTSVYFDGEIRGQLVLTGMTVPEPGTGTLLCLGLGLLAGRRGREPAASRRARHA